MLKQAAHLPRSTNDEDPPQLASLYRARVYKISGEPPFKERRWVPRSSAKLFWYACILIHTSIMIQISSSIAIVISFLSIAFYNVIELNALILSIFRSRKSLYFWSFLVSTWGVAFNATGYLLKDLEVTPKKNLYATLILIGWCSMITGQSVVLYSRLHLVMHNKKRLRAILIMIITNAIWLHIPIIILVYGVNSSNPVPFTKPYEIYEKIQLSVFFVQELIISGFYVWETTKLLRLESAIGHKSIGIMNHLIYVNVLVILLDFTILGLEFADMYEIQTAWKPLVYSVKLKLEFSILNRLVELTRNARSGNQHSYSHTAGRAGDVALGTLKGTKRRSIQQGAGSVTQYEVHVGKGQGEGLRHQNSTVLRTTEFHISSHSRRRNSKGSLADSDVEILAESVTHDEPHARSSASSEIHPMKYGH